MEFTTSNYKIFKEYIPFLESLGFTIEEFGFNTIIIKQKFNYFLCH